jgi:4a-hydroxytetrahydrobiopterin dehydratase
MIDKLSESEINEALSSVTGWALEGQCIEKSWEFRDFVEAMGFINQVALLSEKHNHHPELYNVYNRVRLIFSTHDADGLTTNDFEMARAIDALN